MLFVWQVCFLSVCFRLDNEHVSKQITSFVKEVQEDDENQNSPVPILDLDPEFEELIHFENNWTVTLKHADCSQFDRPILGFQSLPFSPPEWIGNF